jgi:nucleotide-binding universal stress UspA family protein
MPFAAPAASPKDGGFDAIANLINQTGAASADEAEVRDLLRRATAVAFPARLGTLFFNYTPPVEDDERQRLLKQLGQDLVASGLVRDAVPVPEELGRGVSLEALRKLAARLQIDVLVLVSGKSEFKRSEVQPGGWFAAFSDAANYEARTSLLGVTLDVYSGTLFAPISGLGATSPTLLNPGDEGFQAAVRRLQADGFKAAATQLQEALIGSLRQVRDQQTGAKPAASTSPAPASPAPVSAPTTGPSPAPTP